MTGHLSSVNEVKTNLLVLSDDYLMFEFHMIDELFNVSASFMLFKKLFNFFNVSLIEFLSEAFKNELKLLIIYMIYWCNFYLLVMVSLFN